MTEGVRSSEEAEPSLLTAEYLLVVLTRSLFDLVAKGNDEAKTL